MPVFDMTKERFLHSLTLDVYTFGRQPTAIDIMVVVKGLEFNNAYERSAPANVDGLAVRLIHYQDLIKAKIAAGRPRDLNDVEQLRLHKGE